jgi:hypothetical protein
MAEHICDGLKRGNELGRDDLRITLHEGHWFVGNRWDGISYILYCPFCGMKLELEIWNQNPDGKELEKEITEREN